ncbi:MAG TPA: alpha/beta hydrolase [Pseudonocardiaceae bacterium]|nr:alpha/beta hydrolase [Pseudonocardiaceae bacterium]
MTNSKRERGPLLVAAVVVLAGAVLMPIVALPALWQQSVGHGVVFGLLAAVQAGALITVLLRPGRPRVLVALAGSAGWLVAWALLGPDSFEPMDTAIGFTDRVFVVAQLSGWVLLVVHAVRGGRRGRPLGWIGCGIALVVAVPVVAVGVAAAGNGGLPGGRVDLAALPAGRMSSVEYCRPAGIPLGMDIYLPARRSRSAPVAVYVHGGGFALGGRSAGGVGALLANSAGALFGPLRHRLNDLGYVVASIDYRLAPAAQWPAPLDDAECAIRFLRTNAAALGIDPRRVAVWGSSAGGTLASLLGTEGQVNAVVNMFGPADLSQFGTASAFNRTLLGLSMGGDSAVLRDASPRNHVRAAAPPFLILHGTEDPLIGQSEAFAEQLRAAGGSATFLAVRGTGHQLDTPGQQPSADQLVGVVTDFLATALAAQARSAW